MYGSALALDPSCTTSGPRLEALDAGKSSGDSNPFFDLAVDNIRANTHFWNVVPADKYPWA